MLFLIYSEFCILSQVGMVPRSSTQASETLFQVGIGASNANTQMYFEFSVATTVGHDLQYYVN